MQKSLIALLAITTLSAAAQAPIVRATPADRPNAGQAAPDALAAQNQIANSEPIPGVLLRTEPGAAFQIVQTNAADPQGTHLRLDHGRANVNVHHPASKAEILVDLPGGQTALLKDGLYTFNADTGTVRVLKGEAEAFPPSSASTKGIKIKEEQELTFAPGDLRSHEADRSQLNADLLPQSDGERNRDGNRAGDYTNRSYSDRGYGYAPYGYGYPYPAFGYGYPGWGYGYPYRSGIGMGFGFYGGFRGGYYGGYRGGYRGFRR